MQGCLKGFLWHFVVSNVFFEVSSVSNVVFRELCEVASVYYRVSRVFCGF